MPFPLLLPRGARPPFRADVRRLNRWTAADWKWIRRRPHSLPGKFNAGQKLNSAFVAGSIPVMLATGAIMKWFGPFPLSWRTGSTFVHDLVAIALFIAIVGHIVKALSEPDEAASNVARSNTRSISSVDGDARPLAHRRRRQPPRQPVRRRRHCSTATSAGASSVASSSST